MVLRLKRIGSYFLKVIQNCNGPAIDSRGPVMVQGWPAAKLSVVVPDEVSALSAIWVQNFGWVFSQTYLYSENFLRTETIKKVYFEFRVQISLRLKIDSKGLILLFIYLYYSDENLLRSMISVPFFVFYERIFCLFSEGRDSDPQWFWGLSNSTSISSISSRHGKKRHKIYFKQQKQIRLSVIMFKEPLR